MLKNNILKKISIFICLLFIIYILNIFPKNIVEENYSYANSGLIYLLDNNDYVSKVNYYYKSNNILDNAKEIIDILTINSNYEIRTGFKKIIPENTKLINLSLLDNTITLNFTKDLLNISKKYEVSMIEAIVFSLTSLSNISNVIIKVENVTLKNLPNSKITLPEVLNKSININKEYDINNVDKIFDTTIFYQASMGEYNYMIPVTKYTNNENKIEIIINELKSHTTYNTNVIDYINDLKLVNYEINDTNIILNFSSLNNNVLESVKYAINESIQYNYNLPVICYLNNHIVI